jgi:hypothetical protein
MDYIKVVARENDIIDLVMAKKCDHGAIEN